MKKHTNYYIFLTFAYDDEIVCSFKTQKQMLKALSSFLNVYKNSSFHLCVSKTQRWRDKTSIERKLAALQDYSQVEIFNCYFSSKVTKQIKEMFKKNNRKIKRR